VLVVGAGPVGMTLALELARYGVSAVVLDRKPELERIGSRAILIARHTLETFARLGCAEPMLAKAVAIARARTYFRETELFCVEFPRPEPGEIPLFVNLQQAHTERALYDCVAASPTIEVRWATEVVGLRQDDRGVDVEVDGLHGRERIAGAYVVGCDGAGSAVRKLLQVAFPGRTFPDRFLIADIRAKLPFANERRFFFDPPFNPGRQVLIHQQPDEEWRLDWQVPADTDADVERATGRLDDRVRQVVGDTPFELAWVTAYRFHERVARRFRVGRAFLAGDAAHLMAPFGARGMNSGVEDARNLGWKLAHVMAGHAPDSLLESYERERMAAARENVRVTSATMRFMAPPTVLHRLLRNAILRGSLRSTRIRKLVNSGKLATPAVYGGDAGLEGRLAPALGRLQPLLGHDFALLCFCAGTSDERVVAGVAAGARHPAAVVTVPRDARAAPPDGVTRAPDDDGTLSREYGADGSDALFVIRPDGYVAAAFRTLDEASIRRALQSAVRGDTR
jgi:2-polyprenyl-6-methoxyphenol hydroxylase-like FAD-dependent oxidoreductase